MICKLLNSGIQKIYSKYNVLPMKVQWILRKLSRYGQLLKELVQNFCLCAFIFLPYWCVLSFGCMHTVLNFGVINKFLRLLGYVSHGDGDVSSTKSGNRGARRNALYISELKHDWKRRRRRSPQSTSSAVQCTSAAEAESRPLSPRGIPSSLRSSAETTETHLSSFARSISMTGKSFFILTVFCHCVPVCRASLSAICVLV